MSSHRFAKSYRWMRCEPVIVEECEIVSSILKALKKLEDENPPKGRSVIWSSGSASRRTIRRWDITSGWSAVLLWGLLAVVALISVGGIILYLLSPPDRNAVPTASVGRPVAKPIQESPPSETMAKPPPPPHHRQKRLLRRQLRRWKKLCRCPRPLRRRLSRKFPLLPVKKNRRLVR
jgi:hypothetical protein